MLRLLRRSGPGRPTKRRRAVDRRLLAELEAARAVPAPDLYRRILRAVEDASFDKGKAPKPARGLAASYALACGLALTLAAAAIVPAMLTGTEPQLAQPPQPPLMSGAFDTSALDARMLEQFQELEASWEGQLLREARLIADDAREAGQVLLARLPRPDALIER